jgi:hypothetical protein
LQDLGADLNRVRQTVIQLLSGYTGGVSEPVASEGAPREAMTGTGPSCPSCNLPLEGALRYRRLDAAPADEQGDSVLILMLYCDRCGAILRSFREAGQDPLAPEPGGSFDVQED